MDVKMVLSMNETAFQENIRNSLQARLNHTASLLANITQKLSAPMPQTTQSPFQARVDKMLAALANKTQTTAPIPKAFPLSSCPPLTQLYYLLSSLSTPAALWLLAFALMIAFCLIPEPPTKAERSKLQRALAKAKLERRTRDTEVLQRVVDRLWPERFDDLRRAPGVFMGLVPIGAGLVLSAMFWPETVAFSSIVEKWLKDALAALSWSSISTFLKRATWLHEILFFFALGVMSLIFIAGMDWVSANYPGVGTTIINYPQEKIRAAWERVMLVPVLGELIWALFYEENDRVMTEEEIRKFKEKKERDAQFERIHASLEKLLGLRDPLPPRESAAPEQTSLPPPPPASAQSNAPRWNRYAEYQVNLQTAKQQERDRSAAADIPPPLAREESPWVTSQEAYQAQLQGMVERFQRQGPVAMAHEAYRANQRILEEMNARERWMRRARMENNTTTGERTSALRPQPSDPESADEAVHEQPVPRQDTGISGSPLPTIQEDAAPLPPIQEDAPLPLPTPKKTTTHKYFFPRHDTDFTAFSSSRRPLNPPSLFPRPTSLLPPTPSTFPQPQTPPTPVLHPTNPSPCPSSLSLSSLRSAGSGSTEDGKEFWS
ncbi:hypothetical protein PRZ48_006813 [Zasmidium cellare]|uniref:Uncharacterized protein n=1 Tax=Zasmidium cellare TaxID=395010 RepID=A0ABR0EHM2_ZASCE|nr:hypothetical protein PRZ48_006813 [Zasmidium cellare]